MGQNKNTTVKNGYKIKSDATLDTLSLIACSVFQMPPYVNERIVLVITTADTTFCIERALYPSNLVTITYRKYVVLSWRANELGSIKQLFPAMILF